MSEHVLKIHPEPFHDLQSGAKTGEVRNCADRDFKVGDDVRLMMIDETGNPTGIEMQRKITHIQTGYSLPDDICVLSYGQFTAADMTGADSNGYKNGFAAAIKSLPEQQHFTNWAAYTAWRAAQIEAVGDFGGEVQP
ncbi:DUF3850 domain-containing protein [Pseudomonas sp. LB3P58]